MSLGGVPLKLSYGSDYPYREVAERMPWSSTGVTTCPTLARGGFSSVWGASALPYRGDDIADWPVGIDELEHTAPTM